MAASSGSSSSSSSSVGRGRRRPPPTRLREPAPRGPRVVAVGRRAGPGGRRGLHLGRRRRCRRRVLVVVVVVAALHRGAALGLALRLRAVRAAAAREREAGLEVLDELGLRPQHLLVHPDVLSDEVVARRERGRDSDLVVPLAVLLLASVVDRAAAEAAAYEAVALAHEVAVPDGGQHLRADGGPRRLGVSTSRPTSRDVGWWDDGGGTHHASMCWTDRKRNGIHPRVSVH